MNGLFFNIGRGLGYATIPALRKSKQVWRSLSGSDGAAVRAETEFGSALASELRLKSGVGHDRDELDLLQGIIARLAPCVRDKARLFQVEVLRHPLPAAIGLPGGFLFLTGPLLELCVKNPDELAFILGHEMGHVIRGHAMDRLRGRIGAEGLSAVISRGLLNPAFRDADMNWLEVAHPLEAELEADEFGVRLTQAAGFDATASLRWLERLRQLRSSPTSLGNYLSSHPPESERMAQIQSVLKSRPLPYRRPPPPPPPPR